MKALLVLSVVALSGLIASNADARREDWVIRYQCQASGDSARGTKLIQGWQRDTVREAAASAVQMCNSKGFSNCRLYKCYERRWN